LGRLILHVGLFLFLTLLTQVGGVIYLISLMIGCVFRLRGLILLPLFVAFYIGSVFATQHVAPKFGRVALTCDANSDQNYVVMHPLYCWLNRNYVTPKTRDMIEALGDALDAKYPGTKLPILDANFPFIDGFPLLPHLSHDDGRKVDFAFFYRDEGGDFLSGSMRSPIGFWAFEEPNRDEIQPCAGRNDWITMRWDIGFLQPFWPNHSIEPERTRFMLEWMMENADQYGIEKVLLEPHIEERLGLSSDLIRFQGCRAARHDDHIHVQIVE